MGSSAEFEKTFFNETFSILDQKQVVGHSSFRTVAAHRQEEMFDKS